MKRFHLLLSKLYFLTFGGHVRSTRSLKSVYKIILFLHTHMILHADSIINRKINPESLKLNYHKSFCDVVTLRVFLHS